jgi:hypothetical protein
MLSAAGCSNGSIKCIMFSWERFLLWSSGFGGSGCSQVKGKSQSKRNCYGQASKKPFYIICQVVLQLLWVWVVVLRR